MAKKSVIKRSMSKGVLLSVQLLISVIFLFYVRFLNILSSKYFLPLCIIVFLIYMISFLFIKSGVKSKKKTGSKVKIFFAKLTSIAVSVMLVVGCFYISKGNSFLDSISSAFQQTRVFSVYVLKDSKVKELSDLKQATFGIEKAIEPKNTVLAIADIEKELDTTITTKDATNYTELANQLYDGEVDCIVADQAYLSLLEAEHEHFKAETRVIYDIELTEEIKTVTTKTKVTEEPFVMYVTGIDTYGKVSTVSRTDVNLVVCINPVEKQILMVSIPRDTQVTLASYGKMDKLTHSAMYGINETIETLENFLDLKINYYAKTNFTGIIEIVDQLGGITIDSPNAFTTLHGNYKIVKGPNEMDGDKALCFVRERYALPNGDFDRGKNQQLLLKALLNKVMSPKIITNFSSVLGAIEKTFETDMSSDEIKSLLNMQIDDMASWEMYNVQVTGSDEKTNKTYSMPGQYVYTLAPDQDSLDKILKAIDKIEKGQRISDADVK